MYPDSRTNPIIIEGTRSTPALLSQVLVITSVGFFVSALGVYFSPELPIPGLTLISFLVTIGLIFGIRAARKTPALAFGLFLLLALAMGFQISPWINHLLHNGQSGVVFNAALTTAVGMGSLGIVAQLFHFDYRKVGSYALGALLVLILIGFLGMFFHFVSPTFYSYATLAIFSVLVVVDFMRIRNGGDGATAVELAVSIYLDGINIFLALTQIFGGGGSRRD
jgi:FtsH-binding integral membrane protein